MRRRIVVSEELSEDQIIDLLTHSPETPSEETSVLEVEQPAASEVKTSSETVQKTADVNSAMQPEQSAQLLAQPETKVEPPPADWKERLALAEQAARDAAQRADAVIRQVQPQTKEEKPKELNNPFNVAVPPRVVEDLANEDANVRTNALNFIVNQTAAMAYIRAKEEFNSELAKLRQELPLVAQSTVTQASEIERTHKDFYGAFPDLDRPELRNLVVSTAQQVMSELNVGSWSPALRDAIGRRVRQIIAPQPSTPQPEVKQEVKAQQRIASGGKSRPGGVAQKSDIQDFLGL
jgi:hypothetical protein